MNRKPTPVISLRLVLCIVVGAIAIAAVCAVTARGQAPAFATPGPSYTYRGTVLKIVDGDTLDVRVDLGFDVSIRQRLRLLNVFAAERNEVLGKAHTAALAKAAPEGSQITLRTEKDKTDKYGRYVAEVWSEAGVNVNEAMRSSIGTPAGKGIK